MPDYTTDHVRAISEAITQAWLHSYGPSRFEVPMSAVASLCLVRMVSPSTGFPITDDAALADHTPRAVVDELVARWSLATCLWPELAPRWSCLSEWIHDLPIIGGGRLIDGAHAVMTAAVHGGLPTLMEVGHERRSHDVLGHILHQFYNQTFTAGADPLQIPASVTDPQQVATLQPGATVTLAHLGTGTRLMHLAQRLRQRGIAPADLTWQLREIDELSAAVLATNCVLWELGRPVIGISDDDHTWLAEAHEERTAALHDQNS